MADVAMNDKLFIELDRGGYDLQVPVSRVDTLYIRVYTEMLDEEFDRINIVLEMVGSDTRLIRKPEGIFWAKPLNTGNCLFVSVAEVPVGRVFINGRPSLLFKNDGYVIA